MKKIIIIILLIAMQPTFNSCSKPAEPEKECGTAGASGTVIGARCNNGSRSNATGQGACSSNGGVKYWICQ